MPIDFGDFNLGGGDFNFGDWFNPGDFNLDFSFPSFNIPDFNFPDFNFGDFSLPDFSSWFQPGQFGLSDPLALPSVPNFTDLTNQFTNGSSPGFGQFGIPDPSQQGPVTLADLGFKGGAAPNTALPQSATQGSDPLVNLMGTDQGLGLDPAWGDMAGGGGADMFGLGQSPIATGAYGNGPAPLPGLGGAPYAPGAATPGGGMTQLPGLGQGFGATGQPMSDVEKLALLLKGTKEPPSTWDTIAKLAGAFGPTALGAAGLGLQALNRPKPSALDQDLERAKIQSIGQQDALAADRLAFEKQNAEEQRAAQEEMQNALLESRKPGGQANIAALLASNPQLAALYNALTKTATGIAGGGSPEFNAMVEQVAGVDIAQLQQQAQQQIQQAQEMAARTGVNPATVIAKIQQTLLQESAKARAQARQVVAQMLQPGISALNSIGGIFGNLFAMPAAG